MGLTNESLEKKDDELDKITDAAMEATTKVLSYTGVTIYETRDALEELKEKIEIMLEGIENDIQSLLLFKGERKMREQEKEQKKIDDWNSEYKIGQEVEVAMDGGYKIKTETKFEAMLCDYTAIVHLNNFTGGISLDQIRAI